MSAEGRIGSAQGSIADHVVDPIGFDDDGGNGAGPAIVAPPIADPAPSRDPRPEGEREERRRFVRSRFRGGPQRRASDVRDIREGKRTKEVLRRDGRIRRTLACADVLAASVALAAALAAGGHRPYPTIAAAPLLIVGFRKPRRLSDPPAHGSRKSTLDQAPELLQTATVYSLVVWLASDAFMSGGLDKLAVGALWGTLFVGLLAFRVVARRAAARAATPERVLVLGSAQAAQRLAARFEQAHSLRAVLVGRVALDRGDREEPVPVGPLDDLDYLLRRHHVERVIIAPHQQTSDEQLDTIRLVKGLGVKVSVLPRLFEVVGSSMEFDDVDGITLLGLRRYGLSRTSWLVKRSFDVVVASIGLLVASPLLLAMAFAVKVSSSGPILFRQPRVGRRG